MTCPIKTEFVTGKKWEAEISFVIAGDYPREDESLPFFDSNCVLGSQNETPGCLQPVAAFISFTEDCEPEIKRITMVAPVACSGHREVDPWNYPLHFLRLGETELTAKHFAIALQQYEPGCEGTIWYSSYKDCENRPTTKELRALQKTHYTDSGKVALKTMISWMNELRDCSHSTYGNIDSFYALRSHLHTLNYGRQPELMTVTLASSSFVNKKLVIFSVITANAS
jgi:hypothetical protein